MRIRLPFGKQLPRKRKRRRGRSRKRTPEHYEYLRTFVREKYQRNKLAQRCVDCGGDLEESDGIRCASCEQVNKDSAEAYRLSERGRLVTNAATARRWRKRLAADRCPDCRLPREKWPPGRVYKSKRLRKPPKRCPDCTKRQTRYQTEYRKRKAQGVVVLATERARRRQARLRELRGDTYVPLEEQLASTRVRLLRGLQHREWIASGPLFDEIGLAEYDAKCDETNRERDRFMQSLVRLAKYGQVERRDVVVMGRKRQKGRGKNPGARRREYRITNKGRAELRELYQRSKAA